MSVKRNGTISAEGLDVLRQEIRASRDPEQVRVIVCGGTGCRSAGSLQVADALARKLREKKLRGKVLLKLSGCHGFCQEGPVVLIEPHRIFYRQVGIGSLARDVRDIVDKTIIGGKLVKRLLYRDPSTQEPIADHGEIPFYSGQTRIVLRNNGKIDPNSIEDYIAVDGYAALAKALSMDPEEVIAWIDRSGLRGRGGGGFPTGRKWTFCRNADDRTMRYVICNADEGDPGAFMDRSIIEGDPHSVVEGMIIGAYAISRGISPAEGYVYIRAEYPLAVETLRTAIRQAEQLGVLGDNILGTDFRFHIKIKEGAGAFVCGEETALIASIEGKRGMPRQRPPFPAVSGLFGKPTNINNVETWVNVPRIINGGPDWYASIGTETSKGTKVFSLVGQINNSGLIEVPMGTRLYDIIFGIGGGIPGNKKFKAVQTGGPSGGCLPPELLNLPVDYEELAKVGSIMGSGGMIVMDEDTCVPDVARYFVDFTRRESCGKCAPCRLGTTQLHRILEDICSGRGTMADLGLLERLGLSIKASALCGLGQTAPNPVLSTIRYFRDEYVAHIRDKKCPAVVCEGLVDAPCKHACPAGVDVPRYLRAIADGEYDEALNVIRERLPLPSICGRICYHPCEAKCRRGLLDDPSPIRALKRIAGERGRPVPLKRKPRTGKRVAVVGSGPAGLTAAFFLSLQGHDVTVFEAGPKLGGMMRTAIPRFRLPAEVLDAEIAEVRKAGFKVKTRTSVLSPKGLRRKGFHAVFVAVGMQKGLSLGVPGENEPGVIDCLEFLAAANTGRARPPGRRVAVIGGGNSAMDAARTAKRLGAAEVRILYRRTRAQMPADVEEVHEAIEEGVAIDFLVLPTGIDRDGDTLRAHCVRMQLGEIDRSGRPRPEPIPGSDFVVAFDTIISAIGQAPDVAPRAALDADRRGRLVAREDTLATPHDGVFAGGDVVTGPASVIDAVAAGRLAARSIDRYLGGDGDIDLSLVGPEDLERLEPLGEQPAAPRVPTRRRSPTRRVRDFNEVDLGYSQRQARLEAGRCLRCDLEKLKE